MSKSKFEHCPFCGEESYQHQIKKMTLHYKAHSITVNQPGYWCNKCSEGVIGGADRKATQKELQAFRASVDGLLIPDEIKCIREKLSLTQQKASEFFGGGINAFSRYERGETPIPRPLSQLLELLNRHPNLLNELKQKLVRPHLIHVKNSKMAIG
jgi:HTH-type transcriptional regulator/antitoxin MqsA